MKCDWLFPEAIMLAALMVVLMVQMGPVLH